MKKWHLFHVFEAYKNESKTKDIYLNLSYW